MQVEVLYITENYKSEVIKVEFVEDFKLIFDVVIPEKSFILGVMTNGTVQNSAYRISNHNWLEIMFWNKPQIDYSFLADKDFRKAYEAITFDFS